MSELSQKEIDIVLNAMKSIPGINGYLRNISIDMEKIRESLALIARQYEPAQIPDDYADLDEKELMDIVG